MNLASRCDRFEAPDQAYLHEGGDDRGAGAFAFASELLKDGRPGPPKPFPIVAKGVRVTSSLGVGRRRFDAALIAVALFGLWYVVRTVTLVLPSWHVDGAFQTASALFRLDSGQFPGRDFFPYLGLAAVYLPFPLFKLAGADLAASTSAAYYLVLLASAGTVTLVMRMIAPAVPWRRVLIVALLALPVALGAAKAGIIPGTAGDIVARQVDPGNSLRPLRSFAPYLCAALLLLVQARVVSPVARSGCYGLIGGTILWWTNDYGPPAAAMAALVMAVDLTRRRAWSPAAIVAGGGGAIAGLAATLCLLTAFHPRAFLEYTLLDVARDQWWYFEGARVFSPADFGFMLVPANLLAIAVIVALGVRVARRRDKGEAMAALIGFALLAGGLFATIGGHVEWGYYAGFRWWSVLVILAYPSRVTWGRLAARAPGRAITRFGAIALGVITALFAGGAAAAHAFRHGRLADDPAFYHEPALGGFLEVEWRDYIARAKAHRGASLEEYWGLWSAARRQHRGRVDMVIHALGSRRAAHARLIAAMPPVVTSSRPWATWGYHGWAMSVNWWFYAPLLQNYRIDVVSPKTFLWTRARQPDWTAVPCRVSADARRVIISGQRGALYDVRLAYRVDPAARRLLRVYNGLGFAEGWIPLDDRATSARFPVLFDDEMSKSGVVFDTRPAQSGSPRIKVTGCAAAAVPMTDDVRAILPDPNAPRL